MKERVRTVFGVAAGVLVLVGTGEGTAWAQPRAPHGPTVGPAIYKMIGYDGGLVLPFLLRAVNLTPDQQTLALERRLRQAAVFGGIDHERWALRQAYALAWAANLPCPALPVAK